LKDGSEENEAGKSFESFGIIGMYSQRDIALDLQAR
jgi:hypothetical protein